MVLLKRKCRICVYVLLRSRKENQRLQSDYSKLQDSYSELEMMKDRLENKETLWKLNLTDAQKSGEKTREEV